MSPAAGAGTINLAGDRHLMRKLRQIPVALRLPVMQRVLSDAAVPIQRTARTLAAKRRGVLARSIERRVLPGSPAVVAIRPNYRQAPHAHFVEYGTAQRTSSRDGVTMAHGAMPAQPFMRPAARQAPQSFKIASSRIRRIVLQAARTG